MTDNDLQRQSASYRLAALDEDFILGDSTRGVRFLLEYAKAEELRTVFLDYVGAIKGLYETPRWYNGLCANCTTSIYRLPDVRFRCDWPSTP